MNWQKECSVEFLAEKWLPLTLIRMTNEGNISIIQELGHFPFMLTGVCGQLILIPDEAQGKESFQGLRESYYTLWPAEV